MAGRSRKKSNKMIIIIFIELLVIIVLVGILYLSDLSSDNSDNPQDNPDNEIGENLTEEEKALREEQERIQAGIEEREELIEKAKELTISYDYDGAIELIKSYQGDEGGYNIYTNLVEAIEKLEEEKDSLLLYGGVYNSVSEVNHIFFHSLIVDNSKAFDGDADSVGYNMYMTTISEFKNMMQHMYEDDYVLVSIYDLVEEVTDDNGNTRFVQGKIYLPQGKKPFVLSQDDVNYYNYMTGDGFASRIVVGEDGKPTSEMVLDDGSVVTGSFDVVPILNDFIKENPDFSYKGAKGILAITGYEGVLGYRTNDPDSPTYEEDKETVKEVVEVLKEDGWEFASHGWGHLDSLTISYDTFKRDTQRWEDEVVPLVGPTDIYIFPFGIDFEAHMGNYNSDKYHLLKEYGFDFFCGVYKESWTHVRNDYLRMARRPMDGQAMLEFPERLEDLFDLEQIIDPQRPAKDW